MESSFKTFQYVNELLNEVESIGGNAQFVDDKQQVWHLFKEAQLKESIATRERELLEKAISLVKTQQRYMSGLPGGFAEGYSRGNDDAIKDAVAALEKLKEETK